MELELIRIESFQSFSADESFFYDPAIITR